MDRIGNPPTSSTVFFFEEFVPLEFLQSHSVGVQNNRTLAILFSPGQVKATEVSERSLGKFRKQIFYAQSGG